MENVASVAQTGTAAASHSRWSNRFVFILAASGSAVGLGNIWKFPYILGEYGGGAFMAFYLLCVAVLGLPVLMVELYLGKKGRMTPGQAIGAIARQAGRSKWWGLIGWMGLLTGFTIMLYYSVIAGWTLPYTAYAVTGAFGDGSAETTGALFGNMLANPSLMIVGLSVMMAGVVFVIGRGVRNGLESAVNIMMPGLAVILLIMMLYGIFAGDFAQAVSFMFKADFSKFTMDAAIAALGHAFFTLSLGSGAIMMYGSYLPEETSIARSAFWIVVLDTVVALVAGMAIFPLVFANGLEPSAGPGLLFVTLPMAFATMPLGSVIGVLFFVMLIFAALTSMISLIEACAAFLVDRFAFTRWQASFQIGGLIWVLSMGSVYSFAGAEWAQNFMGERNIFDTLDYLTSNVSMPLGGFLMALFAGWVLKSRDLQDALGADQRWFKLWVNLIRFVAVPAIGFITLNSMGIIQL